MSAQDFRDFTHILALDTQNLADLQAICPPDATARLGLLREQSFAQRSLSALAKRGTRIQFLFSPGEESQGAFAVEFGPTGDGLAALEGAAMKVVPGMDHDLTAPFARRDAEALMVDFFGRL